MQNKNRKHLKEQEKKLLKSSLFDYRLQIKFFNEKYPEIVFPSLVSASL